MSAASPHDECGFQTLESPASDKLTAPLGHGAASGGRQKGAGLPRVAATGNRDGVCENGGRSGFIGLKRLKKNQ